MIVKSTLTLPAHKLSDAEARLTALGVQALTLRDAAGRPIHEPAPGETPVWPHVQLEALFPADVDSGAVILELIAAGLLVSATDILFEPMEQRDWTRAWMNRFRPMRFGEHLWICPSHTEPDPAWPFVIRLDPGLAFGSGTHPTTAMCLEWLDGASLEGKRVIDYGAGSGVLAIAAALKGAAHVIAVDHDPQALTACADNAARNGVADRLEIVRPDRVPETAADVLLANILSQPLIELAGRFATLVKPGGACVLSGILSEQGDAVEEAYRPWFQEMRTRQTEHWLRLYGIRRC